MGGHVEQRDLDDPETLFTHYRSAGVYRTVDGGVSWGGIDAGLGGTQVDSCTWISADSALS